MLFDCDCVSEFIVDYARDLLMGAYIKKNWQEYTWAELLINWLIHFEMFVKELISGFFF